MMDGWLQKENDCGLCIIKDLLVESCTQFLLCKYGHSRVEMAFV